MVGIDYYLKIFEHAPPELLPVGRKLTIPTTNADYYRIFKISQKTLASGPQMVTWTRRVYEPIAKTVDAVTRAAKKPAPATKEQAAAIPKNTDGIQELPHGTGKANNGEDLEESLQPRLSPDGRPKGPDSSCSKGGQPEFPGRITGNRIREKGPPECRPALAGNWRR